MTRVFIASILLGGLALMSMGRVSATANSSAARAEQVRTMYFSAHDAKGVAVADLTAADLTVKEGGKNQAISSVKAATGPMQIALLIDDSGTGAFQGGVAQFLQATVGHGQFAISVLNPQPQKIANYIEDVNALRAAIGQLGPRGRLTADGEQIIDAVSETARELQQRKAARPVIIALSTSGETPLSDRADPVLNDLKNSGAVMFVLFYSGITTGKVLAEGPRQSGGTAQEFGSGNGITPAMAKIVDNLMHQYVLTYTLPDGVKPNEKVALTTSRKGVSLTAPTRLPDR